VEEGVEVFGFVGCPRGVVGVEERDVGELPLLGRGPLVACDTVRWIEGEEGGPALLEEWVIVFAGPWSLGPETRRMFRGFGEFDGRVAGDALRMASSSAPRARRRRSVAAKGAG